MLKDLITLRGYSRFTTPVVWGQFLDHRNFSQGGFLPHPSYYPGPAGILPYNGWKTSGGGGVVVTEVAVEEVMVDL